MPSEDKIARRTAKRPTAALTRLGKAGRARRLRRFDLKKTLFILPNAITLAAVFCGFNALVTIANAGEKTATDDFYRAAVFLIFSMFFDLMDGRVARLTRTQSAFGLQMDSLADVISFGVAPALLVHQWVLHRLPVIGLLASFGYVACAAIRLARFNVLSSADDGTPTVPGKYIVGLPSPPASGVLIALVLSNHAVGGAFGDPDHTLAIGGLTIALGLLMVSSVRFRSFKHLEFSAATVVFVLLAASSSAFVWVKYKPAFVLVWLLGIYITLGLFETVVHLTQKWRSDSLRTPADSSP